MPYVVTAWPFAVAMFVGMLICLEIGRRLGMRAVAADPQFMSSHSTVDGAVFALYGLLLAFTFSGAPGRLDTRRQLIAEEANRIGTAYLRLDLLAVEAQPAIREQFRRYVDSRLEIYRKLPDLKAAQAELSRSTRLQGEIWAQVLAASRLPGSHPDATKLLVPALNDMIDITTTRMMATIMHPPPIIFALLFLLALVCSMLAGYAMAVSKGRSWLHILAFAAVAVITVFVVLEIEYPRTGFLHVEDPYDQVLVELQKNMR